MKEISILGYYTTPGYHLGMSDKLFNLICDTVENEILGKYTFPKIKSTVFEILIDTEVKSDKRRVIQLSKTGRGKYFSFRFFLPYNVVMENKKMNISAFIHEFMEGIREALSQFNILPDTVIDQLKEQLIAETKDKMEYEYVMPEQQKQLRKIIDQVKQEFEAKKLHKSL